MRNKNWIIYLDLIIFSLVIFLIFLFGFQKNKLINTENKVQKVIERPFESNFSQTVSKKENLPSAYVSEENLQLFRSIRNLNIPQGIPREMYEKLPMPPPYPYP